LIKFISSVHLSLLNDYSIQLLAEERFGIQDAAATQGSQCAALTQTVLERRWPSAALVAPLATAIKHFLPSIDSPPLMA
jgi:hypothetical protein